MEDNVADHQYGFEKLYLAERATTDRLRALNAELLAALVFARRIMGSGDPVTDEVLDQIDAAIAKARGE